MENSSKDATFGKKFTEEEIREMARKFFEKHFPSEEWEKHCEVCNACNCINNEYCIKCGCQF
jgi:hypothetical protein